MSCSVYLPPNVMVNKVALVVGALVGVKLVKAPVPHVENDCQWLATSHDLAIVVDHADSQTPQVCEIRWKGASGLFGEKGGFFYYFEIENPTSDYGRKLKLASTAEGRTLARKLVSFFGGGVVYDESILRKSDMDYVAPTEPNEKNCPDVGKALQNLQERIMEIKPVDQMGVRSHLQLWEKGNVETYD